MTHARLCGRCSICVLTGRDLEAKGVLESKRDLVTEGGLGWNPKGRALLPCCLVLPFASLLCPYSVSGVVLLTAFPSPWANPCPLTWWIRYYPRSPFPQSSPFAASHFFFISSFVSWMNWGHMGLPYQEFYKVAVCCYYCYFFRKNNSMRNIWRADAFYWCRCGVLVFMSSLRSLEIDEGFPWHLILRETGVLRRSGFWPNFRVFFRSL